MNENWQIALNPELMREEEERANLVARRIAFLRRRQEFAVTFFKIVSVQDVLRASSVPMTVDEIFKAIKDAGHFASQGELGKWLGQTKSGQRYGIRRKGKRAGRQGGAIEYVYSEPY